MNNTLKFYFSWVNNTTEATEQAKGEQRWLQQAKLFRLTNQARLFQKVIFQEYLPCFSSFCPVQHLFLSLLTVVLIGESLPAK